MNVLFDMFYYISSVTDMFVQAVDYIYCAAQDLNKSKEEVKALEKKKLLAIFSLVLEDMTASTLLKSIFSKH